MTVVPDSGAERPRFKLDIAPLVHRTRLHYFPTTSAASRQMGGGWRVRRRVLWSGSVVRPHLPSTV